jgi:hypothetical protein
MESYEKERGGLSETRDVFSPQQHAEGFERDVCLPSNMFVAIIMEGYAKVKEREKEEREKIASYFYKVCACVRVFACVCVCVWVWVWVCVRDK